MECSLMRRIIILKPSLPLKLQIQGNTHWKMSNTCLHKKLKNNKTMFSILWRHRHMHRNIVYWGLLKRQHDYCKSYLGKHFVGMVLVYRFRGSDRYHHGGWHAGRHVLEKEVRILHLVLQATGSDLRHWADLWHRGQWHTSFNKTTPPNNATTGELMEANYNQTNTHTHN